ncbi:MAG: ATP-binding cassette domain-containing protein [Candidatus Magnetomorum sp.]|nr:ATP-binding cassette domain-containing protein [Candidatus Magnetomorum sp.]
MVPLIQFKNVSKSFGVQTVLNQIDLAIEKGRITAIIGKSGVGKSVLLKHMIGLLKPDSGNIFLDGKNVSQMSGKESRHIRQKFSYMFQNMALFDSMTVYENIALPLQERRQLKKDKIDHQVMELSKKLELDDITYKYPSQISGGMKKRVALARALITNPEIILFDEPTTGLDPIRKHAVFEMISNNQKAFNYTAVIVTHEIPDIFYIAHKIAFLEDARILYNGDADAIGYCENPIVKKFIKPAYQ